MQHDSIAVIDFGGQYAHLIATKVRRARVHADVLQPEDPIERFGTPVGGNLATKCGPQPAMIFGRRCS
jgi:hypothetical protein